MGGALSDPHSLREFPNSAHWVTVNPDALGDMKKGHNALCYVFITAGRELSRIAQNALVRGENHAPLR